MQNGKATSDEENDNVDIQPDRNERFETSSKYHNSTVGHIGNSNILKAMSVRGT